LQAGGQGFESPQLHHSGNDITLIQIRIMSNFLPFDYISASFIGT
jgi:hypothetical protein